MVAGIHLEQGFCVRFPADVDGEPLETWEDWSQSSFLGPAGSVDDDDGLSPAVLAEARDVLEAAEEGTHLHLHQPD